MIDIIVTYIKLTYASCGALGLTIDILIILSIIRLIRISIKDRKLNPKHYPLDYLRKHKDEFEDFFKEYPGLLDD